MTPSEPHPTCSPISGVPQAARTYHVTIGQNATFYLEEAETGHKTKRVIDAGTDLEPGVRFTYWLPESATGDEAAPVTLAIADSDGNEIQTFTSAIPDDEAARAGELYLTAKAGMNSFQWPMRHPAGTKMEGSDFHGRPKGPLALPGSYIATLTVADTPSTQPFELLVDPRVTATAADFRAQFELLSTIQGTLNEAIGAVNRIRALKRRLDDWVERLDDDSAPGNDDATEMRAAIKAVSERLQAVEDELVQSEFTSEGDTLNYREKLIEKLSGLPAVVGSADTAPTKQSHQVYEKLSGLINEQLATLDEVIEGDLTALNQRLADSGLAIVGA